MKMFYTQEELSNLSPEELLELTTFGGESGLYFYSDLDKIVKNPHDNSEYVFHFKNGDQVYTQQKSTYDEVILGKARYDLVYKSQQNLESQDKREEKFIKQIEDRYNKLFVSIDSQISEMRDEIKDFRKDAESQINTSKEKWDEQLDNLKELDVVSYKHKMESLDKIISSFRELLN